jgi:hypothetical protein
MGRSPWGNHIVKTTCDLTRLLDASPLMVILTLILTFFYPKQELLIFTSDQTPHVLDQDFTSFISLFSFHLFSETME